MRNCRVSVVTVTFNCEQVIEETILSVVNQSYKNIEYIIIDGKSTDNTISIIEKYRNYLAYSISEADNGIYDAMNKGIYCATGEWIIFMNAGDVFASENSLNEFVERIDEDTIVAYGDIVMQCSGYYYYAKPAGIKNTIHQMPVFHQSTMVRTNYHKKHLFDITFKSSGDYNFFYNCHIYDNCKFQYIPQLLAVFDNTGGMSKDNHVLAMRENFRIWRSNWLGRLKTEYKLIVYEIVIWIKKHLTQEKRMEREVKRLEKSGIIVEYGKYKNELVKTC